MHEALEQLTYRVAGRRSDQPVEPMFFAEAPYRFDVAATQGGYLAPAATFQTMLDY